MQTQLLTVTSTGKSVNRRPRIHFGYGWLAQTGFATGALVQVLTKQNGMDFVLHNENVPQNNALANETKKNEGGKFIHVIFDKERNGAAITLSSQSIRDYGMDIGDPVIAQYEYGIIRVRKLPCAGNVKYTAVGSVKNKATGNPIPIISTAIIV